jgi:hypothetical protein
MPKKIDPREMSLVDDFDKDKKLQELDFLKSNINSLLEEMDNLPTPPPDLLPGLNLEIQTHDYEKDMELIKEETKETLECISSLYLEEKIMKERNISNIIRNDAEIIGNIKFSVECAKRGLVSCMKQLDAGTTNAEMYMAVSAFQKEIRDSNKMLNDLLTKMKSFYKELRGELKQDDINITGTDSPQQPTIGPNKQGQPNNGQGLFVFDPKMIDDILEERSKNPTLLEEGRGF